MLFPNSKKNIVSLLVLGLLSQVKGDFQFLRRQTNELCTPFENRRDDQDSFTFVLLEFEKTDLNSQFIPYISGDQFVDTYNSLVYCEQNGAFRAIANGHEFRDGTDLASPRAVYFDFQNPGSNTVLIEINNFFCNSCGEENYSLFYNDDNLVGLENGGTCDCRGPTVEEFILAFSQTINVTNLIRVSQLRLLSPYGCGQQVITTYSNQGVCPGLANVRFAQTTPELPLNLHANLPVNLHADLLADQPVDQPVDQPADQPADPLIRPLSRVLSKFIPALLHVQPVYHNLTPRLHQWTKLI